MIKADETKRYQGYNVDPLAITRIPDEVKLRIYGKMYRSRCFESQVIKAVEANKVIAPVYLSLGQEAVAAALSEFVGGYYIFAQHRAHDLYLSIGADPLALKNELLGLESGFSHGKAGSSNLQYREHGIRFMGHNSLIGENVPQAAGAALASGEKTLCVFGDGAAEEDYVLETFGFAATKKLPLLFVCVDNGLSILTRTSARRSWSVVEVASGFGVQSFDLTDCPWTLYELLEVWCGAGPMLINCRVCRERWHVGTGIDGPREWARNEIVRKELCEIGLEPSVIRMETHITKEMDNLWNV